MSGTSRLAFVAMLRARPLYWRTTFAVQKIATSVWSGVRVALLAAPSDFTSLSASTHRRLCSDEGAAGKNWSALSSPNGRMVAIHGVCGAAYPGGVSRQTPGPGASVRKGEVEPIGVCRPSPSGTNPCGSPGKDAEALVDAGRSNSRRAGQRQQAGASG